MKPIALALMVWLAVFSCPSEAAAKWTRLSSEHFVFVGDTSERELRDMAQRLELFREVVTRIFSKSTTASSIPTVVVVFQNAKSMAPFRPMFEGKPVELAGYFSPSDDANYMAVNAEQDSLAYGVIFHEYAHFLTFNAVGEAPVWASEGLAEFYQTFSISGARSVRLGEPSLENLALLQQSTLLSLAQLIAVDRKSPMYNERNRSGLLYAESWALVHYLTFGGAERTAQFQRFLSAISQGADGAAAFAGAFPDPAGLERDLRQYTRRLSMKALRIEFAEKLAVNGTSPAETIADEDAAGYLGRLLMQLGRSDDARAYLQKVIDGKSDAARPLATLGRLEWRAGNDDQAVALLERAVKAAPDMAAAQGLYGQILFRQADRAGLVAESLGTRAHAALSRALELDPNNIPTMVALAQIEMMTEAGAPQAVARLRQVVQSAPGPDEYRLALAAALAAQGDYPGATSYLGPLVGRAQNPDIKEAARELLGRIADTKASRPAIADSVSNAPGSRSTTTPAERRLESAPQGVFVPALRPVQSGETRLLGVFSAVDCQPGVLILQIETASGPVPLATARFEDVEFLTYRQDSPGSVPCGAQRPAYRVLATFRTDAPPIAGAPTANRAVAIELLPDGYVPR